MHKIQHVSLTMLVVNTWTDIWEVEEVRSNLCFQGLGLRICKQEGIQIVCDDTATCLLVETTEKKEV